MCEIKKIQKEDGFALISILMFVMFLGMFGLTLATLVVADYKMQVVNLDRPRALYAAQSGIEYAMRGASEYALANNTISGLNNYSETIPTGSGTTATITLSVVGNDNLIITSSGFATNFSQTITKDIDFSDVASYAVYSTGSVSNVAVLNGGLGIESGAANMPLFDLDTLRNIATPLHYYPGNVTFNSPFTFINDVAFAEGNMTFTNFNLLGGGVGNFVSGGDITINSSFISLYEGVMFQPNISTLTGVGHHLYVITGGLLINGDIVGESWFFGIFKNLTIWYDRDNINDFMKYSVNGGPLVYHSSVWRTQH